MRTPVIGFRAHPHPGWSQLETLNYICNNTVSQSSHITGPQLTPWTYLLRGTLFNGHTHFHFTSVKVMLLSTHVLSVFFNSSFGGSRAWKHQGAERFGRWAWEWETDRREAWSGRCLGFEWNRSGGHLGRDFLGAPGAQQSNFGGIVSTQHHLGSGAGEVPPFNPGPVPCHAEGDPTVWDRSPGQY